MDAWIFGKLPYPATAFSGPRLCCSGDFSSSVRAFQGYKDPGDSGKELQVRGLPLAFKFPNIVVLRCLFDCVVKEDKKRV